MIEPTGVIKIGFTGTRKGMTGKQNLAFQEAILMLWSIYNNMIFHHGDCVGADIEASELLQKLDKDIEIYIHPPIDEAHRAFDSSPNINEKQPYLIRNRNIVNNTECLIACPGEMTEQKRGGTWSTIRYARKQGKDVMIIYPDGSREE